MLNLVAIFFGGGIGAIARYLISFNIVKIYGEMDLPIATFSINIFLIKPFNDITRKISYSILFNICEYLP